MLYWLNGQRCFKFIVLLNCFRIIERHLIGFYDRFNCLELKKKWKKIKWIFMEERFYRCRLELQWGDIIMMIKIIVVILTGLETMRMNWSLILSRPQDKSQLNPTRMILRCWWTVSSKEGNILFRSILNSTWLINCFWNVALPLDKIPFKYWIACLKYNALAYLANWLPIISIQYTLNLRITGVLGLAVALAWTEDWIDIICYVCVCLQMEWIQFVKILACGNC